MDILLAGEDEPFLLTLSLELAYRGASVRVATDARALRVALETAPPDIIVLDHIEPADVFALNPRPFGYEGPLLVLILEDLPAATLDLLQGAQLLRKPLSVMALMPQISILLGEAS